MRTLSARATLSSELSWWDLLVDASQCWGNHLKQSFLESLGKTAHSTKNDASSCRQVQELGTANHFVAHANLVGNLSSRIGDATCTAFGERIRKLFPDVHGGLTNVFRSAPTPEGSINSGAESRCFARSISADLYSRSSAREDDKHSSYGMWVPGDASLCTQSKSSIEAASKLLSAFVEICAKHEGLAEASCLIDKIHKQLLFITNPAGIIPKESAEFGSLVVKSSVLTHFCWIEKGVFERSKNICLSILKPFGTIGLTNFGMLLHNHVISNDVEANVCYWSALAALYLQGGMCMDAHYVLESLEGSLAVPFRARVEGCTLVCECSKCMQDKGEQPIDGIHSGLFSHILNGHSAEGHCGIQGLKNSMLRTNFSRSSAYLKWINVSGQSMWTASFSRALSTSTEKCDEDIGEQQSPSQHQSSTSQQQSSLELPESKPQSPSSWPNPDNAASYVLMSNIYADGDRWDEVKRINEMRLKARAWKKPGKAYVEIKAKVHEFIVGDRTHQDSVNIYEKLRKIKRHMGHIGYVPNVDLVLENRSYYDPYAKR